MKTENTYTNLFTENELKEQVLAAQRGEQQAIDALCEAFEPLVMKEAHTSYIVQALGQDAENTAWEYFLEFIMAYKDDKYLLLPGLIKTKLHYALMQKVYRNYNVDALFLLDVTNAKGKRLIEPSSEDNQLEKIHLLAGLQYALSSLSEKQWEIVKDTILHNISLKEYSQKHNISYTAAYWLQKRALAALKAAF